MCCLLSSNSKFFGGVSEILGGLGGAGGNSPRIPPWFIRIPKILDAPVWGELVI